MESQEQRGRRRDRLAALLSTRFGVVALLITMVLVTQAGLVYVAIDQIDTSGSSTLIQPASRSTATRPPISVDPDDGDQPEVPAPAVTRVPSQVEAEPQGPPSETGLDRARERAQPEGVAPPLTGSEPPSQGAQPDRSSTASEPEPAQPGRSEAPASTSASESGTTASDQSTEDEAEEQHPGRGPEGDGPPGQAEDPSGDNADGSDGSDRGRG